MKIIGKQTQTDSGEVRIDTSRPAIVFDPWPFYQKSIALEATAYIDIKGLVVMADDLIDLFDWNLSPDSNTLCWLTNGIRAVCKEQTYLNALKGDQ